MKPAWDSLAQQFATSDKVFIGDVDCTASGKELCERIGVEGFPTIKYFNPPDTDGEDYDGGRDEAALVEFAKSLGPGCSASTLENCSAEQKAELEAVLKLPAAELAAQLETLKDSLAEKEKTHEKLLEGLQAQYEASNKEVRRRPAAGPQCAMHSRKPPTDSLCTADPPACFPTYVRPYRRAARGLQEGDQAEDEAAALRHATARQGRRQGRGLEQRWLCAGCALRCQNVAPSMDAAVG